jgi:hypothetical protein
MPIDNPTFEEWKAHPVTQQVLNYLTDYRQAIVDAHVDNLIHGNLIAMEDQIKDSEALILIDDIVNLKLEDMQRFYGDEESELSNQTRMGSRGR